ncbi:MAG: hypothetical protein ACRES4_06805 [Nevskiales bacterium]
MNKLFQDMRHIGPVLARAAAISLMLVLALQACDRAIEVPAGTEQTVVMGIRG